MSILFRVRRSYTLRERGLKQQQQKISVEGDSIIFPYQDKLVNWHKIFQLKQEPNIKIEEEKSNWNSLDEVNTRKPKLCLEIGFGKGEVLVDNALKRPFDYFVGIEVYSSGLAAVIREVKEKKIKNITLIQADAMDVLPDMFADNILDEMKILFPDPWPKKKHHKRRLLQDHFIEILINKMKKEGLLHIATDWDTYAKKILEDLERFSELKNLFPSYSVGRQLDRPITSFEQKGINSGRDIYEMLFKKI